MFDMRPVQWSTKPSFIVSFWAVLLKAHGLVTRPFRRTDNVEMEFGTVVFKATIQYLHIFREIQKVGYYVRGQKPFISEKILQDLWRISPNERSISLVTYSLKLRKNYLSMHWWNPHCRNNRCLLRVGRKSSYYLRLVTPWKNRLELYVTNKVPTLTSICWKQWKSFSNLKKQYYFWIYM